MLGLKFETSTSWVEVAKNGLEQVFTDHAFAEQKAASNAVSIIINYSEETELVRAMSDIAIEEMEQNDYAKHLHSFFTKTKDRTDALIQRLLIAAMIEARSCERFKVFSENIEDKELADFYRDLMVSEANHYTVFLGFARQYQDRKIVDKKWEGLLAYEAEFMRNRGKTARVHG